MVRITDHELIYLIAEALRVSGPAGNAERISIEAAYARAAVVLTALRAAGVAGCREKQREMEEK